MLKWVNYNDEWNTWEPLENLDGSQDLVDEFEKKEAEKERRREEARAALEAKKKANREKKELEREAREARRREQKEAKDEHKRKKEKSKSIVDTSSSEDEGVKKEPEQKYEPKEEEENGKKSSSSIDDRKKEPKKEKARFKHSNFFSRITYLNFCEIFGLVFNWWTGFEICHNLVALTRCGATKFSSYANLAAACRYFKFFWRWRISNPTE